MTITYPSPIVKPYCNSGASVPPPSGTNTTVANQEIGFPPLQATAFTAGGVPVNVQQMNGVLNFYSKQIQGLVSGWCPTFDAGVSAQNGGYPLGAILYCASNNSYQKSLISGNTANFLTNTAYINDGVNWVDALQLQMYPPQITQIDVSTGGLNTQTYTTPTMPRKPLYLKITIVGYGSGYYNGPTDLINYIGFQTQENYLIAKAYAGYPPDVNPNGVVSQYYSGGSGGGNSFYASSNFILLAQGNGQPGGSSPFINGQPSPLLNLYVGGVGGEGFFGYGRGADGQNNGFDISANKYLQPGGGGGGMVQFLILNPENQYKIQTSRYGAPSLGLCLIEAHFQ